MGAFLDCKSSPALRLHRFASSEFHSSGAYVPDCVLLVVLTFPLMSIAQKPAVDERQPVPKADAPAPPDAIVFILDCSYSMNRQMLLNAPGANVQQQVERFSVAKGGLAAALDEIARSNQAGGQIMVGMRCFGHRVRWVSGQTPPRKLVQPKLQGRVPADLRPSNDVELIMPLGRFALPEYQVIKNELQQIEPWGETPSFLAVVQALADFDNVPPNAKKSIVLITDGKNEQFEPTTLLADVLNAWQRAQDVRIHILGVDSGQQPAQAARAEHGRLANATGGSFSEIASARDLTEKLREVLNIED